MLAPLPLTYFHNWFLFNFQRSNILSTHLSLNAFTLDQIRMLMRKLQNP